MRHEFAVELRSREIKGQDALGKVRKHLILKPVAQDGLPSPYGHSGDTETKLSDRYRGEEQRFDGLGI
jgi:hypothetical protein